MKLGRADSKSHRVLAAGNGALVLHPFAVPTGHRAGAPYRVAMPVAPSPVLGPAVSGARMAPSTGPALQAPNSSREVLADVPNSVAARHLAASSSWRRYPHQAHLRPAHADRGHHLRPQMPPLRIRAARRANEAHRASRSHAAHRRARRVDSVAAGSCPLRPPMDPAFSGQHRTAPTRALDGVPRSTGVAQSSVPSHAFGTDRSSEAPQIPCHPNGLYTIKP